MFASKIRVKIPTKSITSFPKDLSFPVNSHFIRNSLFTAKYNKSEKMAIKMFLNKLRIQKRRKEFWTKFLSRQQCFLAVMNNQSSNSGFIEILLLPSQHFEWKNWVHEIVLNTAAAEASCCFILMS